MEFENFLCTYQQLLPGNIGDDQTDHNNAKVIFQSGEQVPVDDKILPLDWTELAVIIPEVAKQQ